MKLLVTGVTRTGNLGGTAMLCAVEDVLHGQINDFALASILPKRDSQQSGPDHARIIYSDYRYLLLFVAPLCIIFWPLRNLRWLRRMLARLPLFNALARCDAVADISGIAFVDGRGLALLYYNAAIVLPALFFGKPVHKLSQAVGPFETKLNARVARVILSRCKSVAARGELSLRHLHRLGIEHAIYRPDVSFALIIDDQERAAALRDIETQVPGDCSSPLLICSPSAVVKMHCAAAGVEMTAVFADFLMSLQSSGIRVALLPHSADTGIRKNDDETVAREISDAASRRGIDIPILSADGSPRRARAIIGCSSVFLASRFHSMVAALSQAVPVVTVGWSHKYAEAAEPFGMHHFTVDYAKLTPDILRLRVRDALERRAELVNAMRIAAAEASRSSTEGIQIIVDREKS